MKPGTLILGRYEVIERAGAGAMGVVWRAHDTLAGVDVAIKAVPPDVATDGSEMEEIRRNFQLVRTLTHPNIVTLRALERDPETGACFVVQDFVPGLNLKAYRRSKPGSKLSVAEAIGIVAQIAAALDFAHGRRVLHRDVKPENVMITPTGEVFVTDFGLAIQIMSSVSRVSNTVFDTSGTRPYMAPEQWLAAVQDARTDQYALAVMFHELVTGRLPFDSPDPAVLRHLVLEAKPSATEPLDRGQNAALLKALAKQRAERYASCLEFVDRLRGVRAPVPRWLAAAVVLMAVALGAAVGGSAYRLHGTRTPLDSALAQLAAQLQIPAGKRVAVVGFVDVATRETQPLSGVIVERLSTLLAKKGVVRERTRLDVVDLEHDLAVTDSPGAGFDPQVRQSLLARGADLVLTGTFRVGETAIAIDARLVDVHDSTGVSAASVNLARSKDLVELARLSVGAPPIPVASRDKNAERSPDRPPSGPGSPMPASAASPVAESPNTSIPPSISAVSPDLRTEPTAPPGPSAEELELQRLEERAESLYQQKRFTTPANDNAVAVYREILKKQPSHAKALARLKEMRDYYVRQSTSAEQSGDLEGADAQLVRAQAVVPEDEEVDTRRRTLASKKAEAARKAEEEQRQAALKRQQEAEAAGQAAARDLAARQAEAARREEAGRQRQASAVTAPRGQRFVSQGDGTVVDTQTGLQWAAQDNGSNIDWPSAERYAENLTLGGYSDWRLPTQDELHGLYDESNPARSVACGGSVHVPPGFRFSCWWYWASETRGSEAAGVVFGGGTRSFGHQDDSGDGRVLPVRVRK